MDEQIPVKKSIFETLSVPVAIIIAGGLMAAALYYSNYNAKKQEVIEKLVGQNTATIMRPVNADDHILGNPNADVVILEYSDTECPFCKKFHTTLKRVMTEYGKDGKVAWVYRHFPIDALHPKARKEAEATECANELGGNGKFWDYINMLYDITPSNNDLDPAELPKIAKNVGLDVKAFNACLSSGRYAVKVEADYQDAVKAGGRGTPNSILITKDGTKTTIQGAQPYENIKSILDTLLEG